MVPADLVWDRIKLGGVFYLFFIIFLFLALGAGNPSPSLIPSLLPSQWDHSTPAFPAPFVPCVGGMISILIWGNAGMDKTNSSSHTEKNSMGCALEHYPTFSSQGKAFPWQGLEEVGFNVPSKPRKTILGLSG